MHADRDLKRDDIVGKRIAALLQTPWKVFGPSPMIRVCRVFVQLESGTVFELQQRDPFEEVPISGVNLGEYSLIPCDAGASAGSPTCVGDEVVEVLTSNYWPSLGLLLRSQQFLFCSDDSRPFCVGACVLPVGGRYQLCDVATYWGHMPVAP